jgi:DNA-3-methyladenine glycosylase II
VFYVGWEKNEEGAMLLYSTVIPLKPPYSLERLLRRLETHPDSQLLVDVQQSMLRRAFRIGTRPVLASLQFAGSMEAPVIHLHTEATLSPAEQQILEDTIRHMFCADLDLEPVYAHMRRQPKLAILTERFRGLRLLLDSDLFQCMVKTIIGQQINLAFAASLTLRLLELAGDVLEDEEGRRFLAFPTEEAVARLETEDLRPLQFSQRKAEYIIGFARAIVNGTVDLDRVWQMEEEEIIAYLSSLRGIG